MNTNHPKRPDLSYLLTEQDVQSAFIGDAAPALIDDSEPHDRLLLVLPDGFQNATMVEVKAAGHGDQTPGARKVELLSASGFAQEATITDVCDAIVAAAKARHALVALETSGMGLAMASIIESSGVQVTKVMFGLPCFLSKHRERFVNCKAQAMHSFAKAIKDGRAVFRGEWSDDTRRVVVLQGGCLPFVFTGNKGLRTKMLSNQEMHDLRLPQPTLIQAFSLAFVFAIG